MQGCNSLEGKLLCILEVQTLLHGVFTEVLHAAHLTPVRELTMCCCSLGEFKLDYLVLICRYPSYLISISLKHSYC